MPPEEDLPFFSKDFFIIKTPKRSPLLLRNIVLLFSIVCGVYIFSICLKQISTYRKPNRFVDVDNASFKKPTVDVDNASFNKKPTVDVDNASFKKPTVDIQVISHRPCNASGIEQSEIPYVHFPKPYTYSRNECACNPVRFFAILTRQRSGSLWLANLLNSHINVSSNGAIFYDKERRSNISAITNTLDRVYNLDWWTSAAKKECSAAVGFKWMLNEGLMAHHNEIVEYFNRRGVLTIFLFRRNLLRRMISTLANSYDRDAKLLNGTHKAHVHSPHEAEILARYKPKINVKLLISNLKLEEDQIAKALEFFKSTRHIVLYYEDLIKNRTKLMDVQQFLRIPQRDLKSRQVKIHKAPLSDQIKNWNDVRNTLKGTQYESFLQ